MATSKKEKTVPFSRIPLKGTFIRGVSLYMKMSESTAQVISYSSFKGAGDRRKFGAEDQVEYISKLVYKGSNGSSASFK